MHRSCFSVPRHASSPRRDSRSLTLRISQLLRRLLHRRHHLLHGHAEEDAPGALRVLAVRQLPVPAPLGADAGLGARAHRDDEADEEAAGVHFGEDG